VRSGFWYDFKPDAEIKGFHISQPIMPLNVEEPTRWKRLLSKLTRYSETRFKNEVLGVSDSIGTRIISVQELEALCQPYDMYRAPPPDSLKSYVATVGGVDWSGGGTEGVSRTVVWVDGITRDHKLKTLYYRIYPVTNPVNILEDVAEVLSNYCVKFVVGDRGEGHLANNLLAQKLGTHRVLQLHYGSQAKPLTLNEQMNCYSGDRTTLMDNFFMVLKRGGVIYPSLQHMETPIKDTLNIYEEVTQLGKKVWRHAPTQPDDAFHAQLFAWIAAKVVMMDMNFTG
jgi:hypothetical protein